MKKKQVSDIRPLTRPQTADSLASDLEVTLLKRDEFSATNVILNEHMRVFSEPDVL